MFYVILYDIKHTVFHLDKGNSNIYIKLPEI